MKENHPAASQRRVFRFAPSPNGFLHLGHAYSALLNFELARESGGRFLLRIEDIDLARAKPEYEAAIYEDLSWLGLYWERPVRRQSEHFADYAAAPGAPATTSKQFHRLDEAIEKREIEAAGFKFAGEGTFLRVPGDTHDFPIFGAKQPVDAYVLKFRKP